MKKIIAVLLTFLLASCAMFDSRPPEEIAAERAEARWAAIAERDFATAYTYLSPGAREIQTEENYAAQMRRSMVRWNGAQVTSATCTETRCDVGVEVDITVVGALQGARRVNTTAPAEEIWLKSNGRWYFVPKNY